MLIFCRGEICRSVLLIFKFSVLGLDEQRALAFFYMADNLSVYIETLTEGDNLLCHFRTYVNFHAMTHVEHLVHLLPVCATLLLNGLEEWGYGEHVVFDNAAVIAYKMEHLCLSTTRAMNHTVNLLAHFVQKLLDNRSVSTGGGEHQLACVDR